MSIGVLAAALPLLAEPLPTPPLVGQKAPLFSGRDQDGKCWKLSHHIGKRAVFLYFYDKDDTAACTAEACSLRDNMYELRQQGVDVVGVSFDNKEAHENFVFKYNLDFPLLADTCGNIADAYGVRVDPDRKMDRRVSFLIGLDGKIVHVTDSPDPHVHLKELATAMGKAGPYGPTYNIRAGGMQR
jgi:thioredoxin-dependent peroxiredoxin